MNRLAEIANTNNYCTRHIHMDWNAETANTKGIIKA